MQFHTNYDLINLVTPVNVHIFEALLRQSAYDPVESDFIISGFRDGFDLGYRGPEKVRYKSRNLPFEPGVGSQVELWNKIMKEVALGRYAGPYREIPFEYYIQSPIGLVPKDKNKTRLIFHLSHPRDTDRSVNYNTPEELTSVTYPDFEEAIRLCIQAGDQCEIAKSDLVSAFRILCIKEKYWLI